MFIFIAIIAIVAITNIHLPAIYQSTLYNLHPQIAEHKTSKSYKLYFYFTRFMQVHMMRYQDLTMR